PQARQSVETAAETDAPTGTGSSAGATTDGAPMSASEALLQELESADATRTSGSGRTNRSKSANSSSSRSTRRTSTSGTSKTGTSKTATAKTSPSSTTRQGSTTKAKGATPSKSKPSAATTDAADTTAAQAPQTSAEGLQPVPGATFAEVPIESLSANASQPRQVFDDDEMNELASSIREVGVLQPVVVRPWGTDADGQPAYELIMGERRWRAARIAGQDTIPAIIRETAHEDMLRDALLENLHRVQLNPLEEAAAYQQLLEDFGCTHHELAVRIARSRPQISNTLRLLKLPPMVQRRVAAGILSAGHARALLGLTD